MNDLELSKIARELKELNSTLKQIAKLLKEQRNDKEEKSDETTV